MDDALQVHTRTRGATAVLDVDGDVTSAAEEKLVGAYEAAAGGGASQFVLNFSHVEYLNSSGIAIVISLITRMRKLDQHLAIYGLSPHFKKMLHIVGVDRYAKVVDSEDEALKTLEQPA